MVSRLLACIAFVLAPGFALPAVAADWHDTAKTGLTLLNPDNEHHQRTICLLKKLLDWDAAVDDRYIDRDKLWGTTSELRGDLELEEFVDKVSRKMRDELAELPDTEYRDDENTFKIHLRAADDNILKTFDLLQEKKAEEASDDNQVYRDLWSYLVEQASHSKTLYSCYADKFKDEA
jgi:hypothetical protein